jgi:hypothetical protein
MCFNFYGGLKDASDITCGFIICNIIIIRVIAHNLHLNMTKDDDELKLYKHFRQNCTHIEDIVYCIAVEAYSDSLSKIEDVASLYNYFRNYKLDDELLTQQTENIVNDLAILDNHLYSNNQINIKSVK